MLGIVFSGKVVGELRGFGSLGVVFTWGIGSLGHEALLH